MPEVQHEPPYHPIFGAYSGSMPRFYARDSCPAVPALEDGYETILAEVREVLLDHPRRLRENFVPYDFTIRGWRTFNLLTYLRRHGRNCHALPRTTAIVDSIPGVTSAFVSVLEPGARVPSHNGDSNTIQRCHLGLLVPGGLGRCGIEVGGEAHRWHEGRVLVFCDAHRHSAWNDTEEDRVVLVVDVLRDEYRDERYSVCAAVLAAISLTWLKSRLRLFTRLSTRIDHRLHRGLGALFRGRLWLQGPGRGARGVSGSASLHSS